MEESGISTLFLFIYRVVKKDDTSAFKNGRIIRKRETHMKGIILAVGSGTRLSLTRAASKQLMPVYDKPHDLLSPLSALVCWLGYHYLPHDSLPRFEDLLGSSRFGIKLSYADSQGLNGLAQAL